MVSDDWHGFKVRAAVSEPYLVGNGIEIGAGGNPQALPQGARCTYFDKNDTSTLGEMFSKEISYLVHSVEDIKKKFPIGADFLIAHNVLEHNSSEVKTLIEWHEHVRVGGIVVVSVPDKTYTKGDTRRLVPSASHILEDYLFCRNEFSYSSKEHIYGFIMNWVDAGPEWSPHESSLDRGALVNHILNAPYASIIDFHFHAHDEQSWDRVFSYSSLFGNRGIELIEKITPTSPGDWRPSGEIIYIYRIKDRPGPAGGLRNIENELLAAESVFASSLLRIRSALSSI